MWKQLGGFVAAVGMLVALTCPVGAAEDGKVFRWKLRPDETLKFRMVQDMTQDISMGQGKPPMAMTTKLTMDMAWKVLSVDAQGVVTMDQSFQRVQMKIQSAQGVLLDFDSAAGKEPEGMAKMLAPMFEVMLKKPFRSTFTSRGELKEVKLPQGMVEGLSKGSGGNAANILSEDTMKQFGMMSVFPEGPIAPGQSWTHETTMKNPAIGPTLVKTTFRYLGPETRDGKVLDKLELTMTMKPETKKPEAEKPEGEAKAAEKKVESNFTASEGKGVLLFDNVAGRVVESTMNMKMTLEMNVMGQKITQDMTMKMRMSPLPDAK